MLDALVIRSCMASVDAYRRVAQYVDVKEFSPQAQMWWPLVEAWYAADADASAVEPEILRERGKRSFPEKHRDTLLAWFDDMPEPTSTANVAGELLQLKRQQVGLELAQLVQADPTKAVPVAERWLELHGAAELSGAEFVKADIEDTFSFVSDENRVALRPDVLNRRLGGGALPGDFILIFGRTNAGKSLFALNMACGLAREGHEVVYICNEEKKQKIQFRMICNLVRGAPWKVREAPERAKRVAVDRGINNIHLYEAFGAHPADIQRKLEQHPNAKMLVVDQIRHLEGGGQSLNQRLEANAVAMRNIIGEHGVVGVFVTQAGQHDPQREAPLWLDISDIDSSRTGLPGQADIIIGVGMNEDMRTSGTRAISLPKIKEGDDTGFTVRIDTDQSRIGDN